MFKYHNFRTFLITPPETSGLYIKTKSGSQKTIIQENKNTHFPEKSQKTWQTERYLSEKRKLL